MKKILSIVVLVVAAVAGFLCVFGDDSYAKLSALKKTLEIERERNAELDRSVGGLKREVRALQNDPRAMEKAARNELGMARPSEQIFFFDKSEEKRKRE